MRTLQRAFCQHFFFSLWINHLTSLYRNSKEKRYCAAPRRCGPNPPLTHAFDPSNRRARLTEGAATKGENEIFGHKVRSHIERPRRTPAKTRNNPQRRPNDVIAERRLNPDLLFAKRNEALTPGSFLNNCKFKPEL